jgi:hypothetical protein
MVRVAIAENGYRCGETHHRARETDALVAHVRHLHEDCSVRPMQLHEMYPHISLHMLRKWVYYKRRNVLPCEYVTRGQTLAPALARVVAMDPCGGRGDGKAGNP